MKAGDNSLFDRLTQEPAAVSLYPPIRCARKGSVWIVTSQDGKKPDHGLVVVSTRQMAHGVQYRVLGNPDASYAAVPDEPSLEDG